MKKEYSKKKPYEISLSEMAIVVILAIIPIAIVHVYRKFFMGGLIPGVEPYRHIEIAKSLGAQATPYHYLLHFFPESSYIFISALLGMIAIAMAYFIAKKRIKTAFLTSIIIALSPVFIYTSLVPNPDSLLIILILLSIWLVDNKHGYALIIIPAILASLFGVLESMIFFVCISGYLLSTDNEDRKKVIFFTGIILILSSIVFYNPSRLYSLQHPFFMKHNLISSFFSDAGAISGVSFFIFLASLFGIIFSWKDNKSKYLLHYLAFFIFLIVAFFFYPSLNFYLNFPIAGFAAFGLFSLYKRKWSLVVIKNTTILLVISGFIFSLFLQMSILSKLPPTPKIKESISNLDGTVLSHHSNGYWIKHFSSAEPYTNPLFQSYGYKKRLNISDEIFMSRNPGRIEKILNTEKIKYILITEDMIGTVWKKDDEGILLLFRNTNFMGLKFKNSEAQVWEND